MSRRSSGLLILLAAIALALAPAAADARVGGGGSMGSRGGMTWSAPPSTRTAPNGAAPMERSYTQQSPMPGTPGAAFNAPRPSFMSGLMGGIVGAGLLGMLLGGGFFGHGLGFGGFFGLLLQVILLAFVARWVMRTFFARSNPAVAGGPGLFSRGASGGLMGGIGGAAGAGQTASPAPVQIVQEDFQTFEQMLLAAQAAWSAGDLNALRGMATPEMVSYFAEQLTDLSSRGLTNSVTDVHLQSGDLAQAWAEHGRQYATVAMRFSMVDVTKDAMGHVVDGSPTEHETVTELWTFVRAQGGQWILSAIQQGR